MVQELNESTKTLTRLGDHWVGTFNAMASPCVLLIDVASHQMATEMLQIAYTEAKRIEQKFSRYRSDNLIYKINNSNNETIEVDDETANLLDYAEVCWKISDGSFDVTS